MCFILERWSIQYQKKGTDLISSYPTQFLPPLFSFFGQNFFPNECEVYIGVQETCLEIEKSFDRRLVEPIWFVRKAQKYRNGIEVLLGVEILYLL